MTDAGLEHLKGLTQLRVLNLANTKVTDAGLEHLKGLTQLRMLYLDEYPSDGRWLGAPQGAHAIAEC